jgi:hypothetical protein
MALEVVMRPLQMLTTVTHFLTMANGDTCCDLISSCGSPTAAEVALYVVGRAVVQLFHHTSTFFFWKPFCTSGAFPLTIENQ